MALAGEPESAVGQTLVDNILKGAEQEFESAFVGGQGADAAAADGEAAPADKEPEAVAAEPAANGAPAPAQDAEADGSGPVANGNPPPAGGAWANGPPAGHTDAAANGAPAPAPVPDQNVAVTETSHPIWKYKCTLQVAQNPGVLVGARGCHSRLFERQRDVNVRLLLKREEASASVMLEGKDQLALQLATRDVLSITSNPGPFTSEAERFKAVPVHIFINNSPVFKGAQLVNNERDVAIRVDVERGHDLFACGRPTQTLIIGGGSPHTEHELWNRWKESGYSVAPWKNLTDSQELRNCVRHLVSNNTTATALVLVVGDVSTGSPDTTIAQSVITALQAGIPIEVWVWHQRANSWYHSAKEQFPDLVTLFELEDYRDRITFRCQQRQGRMPSLGAANAGGMGKGGYGGKNPDWAHMPGAYGGFGTMPGQGFPGGQLPGRNNGGQGYGQMYGGFSGSNGASAGGWNPSQTQAQLQGVQEQLLQSQQLQIQALQQQLAQAQGMLNSRGMEHGMPMAPPAMGGMPGHMPPGQGYDYQGQQAGSDPGAMTNPHLGGPGPYDYSGQAPASQSQPWAQSARSE